MLICSNNNNLESLIVEDANDYDAEEDLKMDNLQ